MDLLDLGELGLDRDQRRIGRLIGSTRVDLRSLNNRKIIGGKADADADGGEDEDVDARHPPFFLSTACGGGRVEPKLLLRRARAAANILGQACPRARWVWLHRVQQSG